MKSLIPVNFYSIENLEIPSFVGRYDLMLIENGESKIIDYSFDPFSTNLPFEMKAFVSEEAYFEYFEQGLGRLYNIYDLENDFRTDVRMPGIVDKSFWWEGRLIACTRSDIDFSAKVAIHDGSDNWGRDNFEIFYESEEELGCSLGEDGILRFDGKEEVLLSDYLN